MKKKEIVERLLALGGQVGEASQAMALLETKLNLTLTKFEQLEEYINRHIRTRQESER